MHRKKKDGHRSGHTDERTYDRTDFQASAGHILASFWRELSRPAQKEGMTDTMSESGHNGRPMAGKIGDERMTGPS